MQSEVRSIGRPSFDCEEIAACRGRRLEGRVDWSASTGVNSTHPEPCRVCWPDLLSVLEIRGELQRHLHSRRPGRRSEQSGRAARRACRRRCTLNPRRSSEEGILIPFEALFGDALEEGLLQVRRAIQADMLHGSRAEGEGSRLGLVVGHADHANASGGNSSHRPFARRARDAGVLRHHHSLGPSFGFRTGWERSTCFWATGLRSLVPFSLAP